MKNNYIKIFLVTILSIIAMKTYGQQKAELSGRVFNFESRQSLSGATIIVSRIIDTVALSKTVSNNEGRFHLPGLPMQDSLLVKISYTGLDEFFGTIVLKERTFKMENIGLRPAPKLLNEVTVKAYKRPYVIREDTIEFDATAIKTAPNSKAGDLLNRIPGLTVDSKGRLVYNGKPVTKIFVDGRVFFSEDGGVALAHIPSEFVDKIQISDVRTALEKELEKGRPVEQHALNLKLKVGKKYFGDSYAGTGTEKRYDLSGFASSMDKRRLSIFGGLNNVNKAFRNAMGKVTSISTRGGGITETLSTGVDYDEKFKNGQTLNGQYNFSRPVTTKESLRERRENVLPDSSLFSSSIANANDRVTTHRVELISYLKAGLKVTAGVFVNDLSRETISEHQTVGTSGSQINGLLRNYHEHNSQTRFSGNIQYMKKIKNRFLAMGLRAEFQSGRQDDHNQTLSTFYNNSISDQFLDQMLQQRTGVFNTNFSLSYEIKSGKYWSWRFLNSYSLQTNSTVRDVLTLDHLSNLRVRDVNFSHDIGTQFHNNRTGTKLEFNTSKSSAMLELPVIQIYQLQQDRLKAKNQHKSYLNLSPAHLLNILLKREASCLSIQKLKWIIPP